MTIKTSIVVDSQAPEFIRSDYAKFITFLQKYYQYVEQTGKANDVLRTIDTYNDIDVQDDEDILSTFYTLFLPDFPQFIVADKKFVLKHIAEFYNSKGSIDSIKAFFRILYGEEIQIFLPKEDILKLDAGIWRKTFKIKIYNLSDDQIEHLLGSEIYQVDAINGHKTVKARVVDYDPNYDILYLSADNLILNFTTADLVYAINVNGTSVTFNLKSQLSTTTPTFGGQNYAPGDSAVLPTAQSNTENIKVSTVSSGTVEQLVLLSRGDNYSIYDTVDFGTPLDGEVPATARVQSTINKEIISEINDFNWLEPEDKFTFENNFEIRQEYGNFGPASAANMSVTDETTKGINTGSISSSEFGILAEQQQDDSLSYTRSSYTYNQGLFRTILPRVGAEANYALNWAKNEGISISLIDEELYIGSINCTEGTPPNPGIILIQFDTDTDYNALEYYELSSRGSSTAVPQIGTINKDVTDTISLDSKIANLSLQQQLGAYELSQNTLSPLYPFSENAGTKSRGPVIYIRETNTLCGHDLNTTRPWEYRFVFRKDTVVKFKIFIMPVQYDLRSVKIIGEDGTTDFYEENDSSNILIQENYDGTVRRVGFDPSNVTKASGAGPMDPYLYITIPSHGFKYGEIIRYNTFTDIEAGIYSDTVGGITDGQLFYCVPISDDTISLLPYGLTSEAYNANLPQVLTPAATVGTTCYFTNFAGSHVTNGSNYTSTAVTDSAITISAKKRSCGTRDMGLKYNLDPNIPTDGDTGFKTMYPYTVDNKVYLFQSINENTDYLISERNDFDNTVVPYSLEINKTNPTEIEDYVTNPFIALEKSDVSIKQNILNVDIPDYAQARVMVERKSLQMVDDINRGQLRLYRAWNDYADISTYQELYNTNKNIYSDEYSDQPYVNALLPNDITLYSSGPSEFANFGPTMMVASSKNNSIYYTDGTGQGNFIYSAQLDDQRRISFVESTNYDNEPAYPMSNNAPLGITKSPTGTVTSETAYNSNKKRYFTINFSLPRELNYNVDMPFEVNLTNIIESTKDGFSFTDVDFNNTVSLEGVPYAGSDVWLLEDGGAIALETNSYGYTSLAQQKLSIMNPTIMLEFFSPSLSTSNPRKHLVYYANKADYTKISSDVQRTIYTFMNCWSPNQNVVPDTTVKDYTVTIKSLQKSDYIIEKISDSQLLANDPQHSVDGSSYLSPFVQEVYIVNGQNDYGKYITMYPTYEDAVAGTNSITPFSLGSNFASDLEGNEMFYNPVVSGTTVSSAYANPLASVGVKNPFTGLIKDDNISIARFFDPATDVSSSSITVRNHNFVSGSWVRFRSDFNSTVPTGLVDNTTYYVKVIDANTVKLCSSISNYNSNTYVSFTAFGTAGKTCSLQTVPQSLNFNSIKDLSFDTRLYVNSITIDTIDTITGGITFTTPHTLSSLSKVTFTTTGTVPTGLVNNSEYYTIYVDDLEIKFASSLENASNNIPIIPKSIGSGTRSIVVKGTNGNLLPNDTLKEQQFYTPGQYTNYLQTGDRVTIRTQRSLSPLIDSGQTMYVKDSASGSSESFGLTTKLNLTTNNFGYLKVLSTAVDPVTNTITAPYGHTFYTGDEIVYTTSGTSFSPAVSTVYVIKVDSSTFKIAASFIDAVNNNPIDIISIGTGNQYFTRTNTDTTSEIAEIIPYSTQPNYAATLNPGVTGTGIEEFTITYASNLQTETGYLDQVVLTSPGHYRKVPTVTIKTAGQRSGAGADIYPITNQVGSITGFEIMDGGVHNVSRTLYVPYSFMSDTISGNFVQGETIKVGTTEVGTLLSKEGHYFKIDWNQVTSIALGNTITGVTSGATALVGRAFTIASIAVSEGTSVVTTGDEHHMVNQDMVYISGFSPNIADGYYYASIMGSNKFRLYTDRRLSVPVTAAQPSGYTAYTAVGRSGMFTAIASAAPAAITESTENGSSNNYASDKNLLNTTTKLQDSHYYQDYSYVVRGANSHDNWKPYFNKLVHPAGFAVFGEVDYFTVNSGVEKLGNTVLNGSTINNTSNAIITEMTT
jgi:hypothetical protein